MGLELPEPSRCSDLEFSRFLARLRQSDERFAEVSILHGDDVAGWQAAVYLLTANEPLWGSVKAAVTENRSLLPLREITNGRHWWDQAQMDIIHWAAHFWDPNDHPVKFPQSFERFLFERWIVSLYLRKEVVPASPRKIA